MPDPTHTWRLTFAYEGDDVRLVDRQRVEMVPPPPDADLPDDETSGVRVVLRDTDDRVVYQRAVHDPIRREYEVFPQDANETPTWVPNDNPTGTFEVLVPDVDGADDVALRAAAPAPDAPQEKGTRRARDLVRVRLHDEPPRQEA
jgi:hypothetical protein